MGSPFWGFNTEHKIGFLQRLMINFLATFLEVLPINGKGSNH